MKYRYINVTYSAKTNPEVMAFQLLVRNYSNQLKKYKIKVKYIKNIKIPFKIELFDMNKKKIYETFDYRRLKFIIHKVGFLRDENEILFKNNLKKRITKNKQIKNIKTKTKTNKLKI